MTEDLVILKLGGAAITDKNTPFTAKREIISQIFKQLQDFDGKLIIIHGAGSFAHTLAKDYKVANGLREELDPHHQKIGVSKIRNSMQRLHQIILDEAEKYDMKTFSLPISSTLITKGQENIESSYLAPYDNALDTGFIPISFGDMCFDTTSREFIVVSGDRIIKLLGEYLQNYRIRVIFGTDVDGLYDKDPQLEGAKRLDKIKFGEIDQWLGVAGESSGIDVTGGMEGKLRQIQKISNYVEQIDIINLTTPGRLKESLSEEEYISTTFYK